MTGPEQVDLNGSRQLGHKVVGDGSEPRPSRPPETTVAGQVMRERSISTSSSCTWSPAVAEPLEGGHDDRARDARDRAPSQYVRGRRARTHLGGQSRGLPDRPLAEEETHGDAEHAQQQVDQVVQHGVVLVRQEPEQVGNDEAHDADEQVHHS